MRYIEGFSRDTLFVRGWLIRAFHAFAAFSAAVGLTSCGGGGSEPANPSPPPAAPISYTISVSAEPAPATASVGYAGEATLTWVFRSTATNPGAVSYTVSSSTAGVRIAAGSGSVAPGTSIQTQLSFTCATAGAAEIQLTLRVGTATETLTWAVMCTEEQIAFTPVDDMRVARTESALASLRWRFSTTGDESNALSYEVSSDVSRLQITNSSGSVQPGVEIDNRLRYACAEIGDHRIALHIRVGSASERVEWMVTCTFEDIHAVAAKFHQGPLLGRIDFTLSSERVWQATPTPMFYQDSNALRLGANRQLFVTVEFTSAEANELDFDLFTPNMPADVSIEKISASTLAPNLSGTRTHYIRRVVFDVNAPDVTKLGAMHIRIDPNDAFPQRDETLNDIPFDVNLLAFDELPTLNLHLIPIVAHHGEPDLTDLNPYLDAIYDLMPIGVYTVKVENGFDVTNQEPFDPHETLTLLFERWLREADRDEFHHGIFKQLDTVELCGLAYVGANIGLTGEISPFCSDNTIAHELGHNLSLQHAPACGADLADPDPDFPYSDGSIGAEGGWRMRARQPIGSEGIQLSKVHDIMAYCIETFTSQYSYGKANDYFVRRFGPTAVASMPPTPVVRGFDVMEGRSYMLMGAVEASGAWILRSAKVVAKSAFPPDRRKSDFRIRLIHLPSGTVVYEDGVHVLHTDHGPNDDLTWGVRLPIYTSPQMQAQVVDRDGNVLFEHHIED